MRDGNLIPLSPQMCPCPIKQFGWHEAPWKPRKEPGFSAFSGFFLTDHRQRTLFLHYVRVLDACNAAAGGLRKNQSLMYSPHIYSQLHFLMTFFSSSGFYSLQTGRPSGTAASGSSPVISWWASSQRSLQSSWCMKRELLINEHK